MTSSSARSNMAPGRELRLSWGGRFDGTKDVQAHSHMETELVVVTAGHCRIDVAGQSLDGPAGALFVLPAETMQFQATLGRACTTFIGFRSPPGLFDESARVLMLAAKDPIWNWCEQLCDWQLVSPPLSPGIKRRLLEVLLRRIGELDAAGGKRAQQHPAVAAAIAHLEHDPCRPMQLTELATAAGVSVSHLGALFAEQCGCSPMHYLQERRLDHACWLLDNPYLRIHEVAQACGYEDVNYFVRLFRRRFGQPPGRWRRQRVNPPKES